MFRFRGTTRAALTLPLLVFLCPGEVAGFELHWTAHFPPLPPNQHVDYYSPGDLITVDLYLDAEPGIVIVSPTLLFRKFDLIYDPVASAALPPRGPGTSGAQPSYILYAPGAGIGVPSTILYPRSTPAFPLVPGTEPRSSWAPIRTSRSTCSSRRSTYWARRSFSSSHPRTGWLLRSR
jgi:hypothetical protein